MQPQANAFTPDAAKMRWLHLFRTVSESAKLMLEESDFLAAKLGQKEFRKTFITLTYRNLDEWEPCHISRFTRLMRQWFGRHEYELNGETVSHRCRFVWVAELQKRGALHYHVMVFIPRSMRLPKPDTCGWWPHGFSKIETARNPVGYLVKYVSKISPDGFKKFPKGVRIHGFGGMDKVTQLLMRERQNPKWFREELDYRNFEKMEYEQEESNFTRPHRTEKQPDGSVWFYMENDEDGQPSFKRTEKELEEMFMLSVGIPFDKKPNYKRVKGGFTDCRTGEFFETPWWVDIQPSGQVIVKRKQEKTNEPAANE